MNEDLQKKYQYLVNIIKKMNKVCIAYSGGVDSTFLLKICRDTLNEKHVLAVTAISETYTKSEINMAQHLAQIIEVKHIMLKTNEIKNSDFTNNTSERCYFCKRSFYKELFPVAYAYGFASICDGSNADDQNDYRPGRKAAAEFGVLSPLIEAGLKKEEIRILSQNLGIPEWHRPANSCLASRIPYGTRITLERLTAVEQSEEFIRSLGFRMVRVRYYEEMARIEVLPEDIPRLMDNEIRLVVLNHLKSIGFIWISVDIEGYRMGSMNELFKIKGEICEHASVP